MPADREDPGEPSNKNQCGSSPTDKALEFMTHGIN